ncbi:MAG: hypothetical protein QNK03_03115 [Myxococcota bacterium]|nr:hypothetical protein [Myxococcota bacterium]
MAQAPIGTACEPAAASGSDRIARLRRPELLLLWARLCMLGTVLAVGARVLHYANLPLGDRVQDLLSRVLNFQIYEMVASAFALLVLFPAFLLALLLLGVDVGLRRRGSSLRLGSRVERGRQGSRPWLAALLWTLMLVYNPAIDLDPELSNLCLASLVLLAPSLLERAGARTRGRLRLAQAAIGLGIAGTWWIAQPSIWERLGLAIFAAGMLWLVLSGNARLAPRDRCWLALALAIFVQFLVSMTAVNGEPLGGVRIGHRQYAYTFCEDPERNRLYAAVPCDLGSGRCEWGFVAEHDLADLSRPPVEHQFFSESFHGRLVHLACLEDTIHVGMAETTIDGEVQAENVMAFRTDDPSVVTRSLFGGALGPRAVYDARHGAVYYTSEWSQHIYRYDLESEELHHHISDGIYGPGVEGSVMVENHGLHEGRDTVIFSEWLSGSKIYEVDRSSLEHVGTYDAGNGGNHAAIVDDGLDRIWSSGVWGIDVIDMATGEALMRRRLGVGTRLPVIDERNRIAYVPTTVGRIFAFDRDDLRLLGNMLVGTGGRHPHITLDGRYLLAGNQDGYSYWDTRRLAAHWRGGEAPPAAHPGEGAGE